MFLFKYLKEGKVFILAGQVQLVFFNGIKKNMNFLAKIEKMKQISRLINTKMKNIKMI